MKSVSNILVPIDFSKSSKTALKLAFDWSNVLKCHVIILHAYRLILEKDDPSLVSPRAIKELVLANKMNQFEELKKEIDFSLAHSSSFKLELGFIPNCLTQLTEETKIDLIIFGVKPMKVSHSKNDLRKVLSDTKIPLLVVNENHTTPGNEVFDNLENKIQTIDSVDFLDNMASSLSQLENNPKMTYMIHPSSQEVSQSSPNQGTLTNKIMTLSKAH